MTEYLYDKENPKSRLRYKPQGWESFYRGMPNHYERTEMIGRRLMKDYDGDLSKISLNMKKPYDPGQKWRTLKNYSKFLKNPIGFTLWRYFYQAKQNRPVSIWYAGTAVCVAFMVYQMMNKQTMMRDYINNFEYNRGIIGWSPLNNWNDKREVVGPWDVTATKKKMSNWNALFKNYNENCVTTAYWCRDQNFRKYFEMRKKNGIEPSVNYKNYYNWNNRKNYYNGLLEAKFMLDDIEYVQDK